MHPASTTIPTRQRPSGSKGQPSANNMGNVQYRLRRQSQKVYPQCNEIKYHPRKPCNPYRSTPPSNRRKNHLPEPPRNAPRRHLSTTIPPIPQSETTMDCERNQQCPLEDYKPIDFTIQEGRPKTTHLVYPRQTTTASIEIPPAYGIASVSLMSERTGDS